MLSLALSSESVACRRPAGVSQPGVAAAIASIDASGWSATYTGTPPTFTPDAGPTSQHYFMASRQGYDATGAAQSVSCRMVCTARVRQAYPNQASLSAATVAIHDYIYSTDTISGVTNNSAETSPKPIAQWIMPGRAVVGNALALEIAAFHRNGVACVEFIATDGSLTVSQKVSTTAISGRAGDANSVPAYQVSLDITTLATGLITVNAKVYPSIGAAAAILDSSASSEARGFSPRYFAKNATLAASPPYAYVKSTGVDATGVWSTTAATASATPFLTVQGAFDAIADATRGTPATGGKADGCIIRVGSGSFALTSTTLGKTQNVGYLTITRDPAVARASSIVTLGAASWSPKLSTGLTAPVATACVRFADITIQRSGALAIGATTVGLDVIFDDVDWDNALTSNASPLSNTAPGVFGWAFGMNCTTATLGVNTLSDGTVSEWRILRGVIASSSAAFNVVSYNTVGCRFTKAMTNRSATKSVAGGLTAFTKFLDHSGANSGVLGFGQDLSEVGFAFVQNVVEFTSATANPDLQITNDAKLGNVTHVILWNNSFAGAWLAGRWNTFYDDGATRRTSKLQSVKGNIAVQINTKSDVFRGVNEAGADASSATGNWAFLYGAGCQGNFSMYIDANSGGLGTSFAQAYPGLGSSIGTSSTVRNDPLFTTNQATTWNGTIHTAGAGSGTYTIGGGSPAKGIVATRLLSHDLAGNARLATLDAAGAYA